MGGVGRFKTYIPSKPDKNGFKIMLLCDAKSSYMLNAEPYTGKKQISTEGPLSKYYLLSLTNHIHNLNRTLVTDNWFRYIDSGRRKIIEKENYFGAN